MYLGQKYAYEKGYEYIILSDNDAIPVDQDLVEELVRHCNAHSIATPRNIAENENQDLIFHYGCFTRNVIEIVGFIDWKLFLYGDDVEYANRLKSFGIAITRVDKKYYHPMKYHFGPNRAYFEIRNELENAKRYLSRRRHLHEFLLTRIIFYKLFEPTKYKVLKEAVKNWFIHRWDNSFIQKRFDLDVRYERKSFEEFAAMLQDKKLVVTHNKRIEKFLHSFPQIEYSLYSRQELFNPKRATLLQNSYIKATLFYDEVYYFVDIDEEESVVYFKLPKIGFFHKIVKAATAYIEYLFIIARFYYVAR